MINQDISNFLEWVSSEPRWEGEWLDMLSMLEYIGCRKVLKAVNYNDVSLDVLQHVQEEASHAWLLKKMAARQGLGTRPWSENPFAKSGWRYFHELDSKIADLIVSKGGTEAEAYPAVSWAIETRALSVYRLYVNTTSDESVRKTLAAILAQEKRHEGYFGQSAAVVPLREIAKAEEEVGWSKLLNDLFAVKSLLTGH